MCWWSWYWWAECAKHAHYPLEDSCLRPGTCKTAAPWRYSKVGNKNCRKQNSWEQLYKVRGNWTSKSTRPTLPAAEVWGSPRKGATSGGELLFSVEIVALTEWWYLVLQLSGVSPFIHEGWGSSRSPPPGSWAAFRLAGQSQGRVSLWEGRTAGWNSHIVPGQMYPFHTAMQLILFANKKGTLAVFHDPLWAFFYVEELII